MQKVIRVSRQSNSGTYEYVRDHVLGKTRKESLATADFLMKFEGNKYDGEQQVIQILTEKQKFTTDVSSDTFRKKVEQRLFTTDPMLWSQVKERAATNPQWQWHRRDALDVALRLRQETVFVGDHAQIGTQSQEFARLQQETRHEPRRATSIAAALEFCRQVLPRRAVLFLISDLLDEGYLQVLRHANRKHDVVAALITDPREAEMPPAGLVTLEDPPGTRPIRQSPSVTQR